MNQHYDEHDLLNNETWDQTSLKCPVCSCDYIHAEKVYALKGNDEYEQTMGTAKMKTSGSSGSRRGAVILRFFGECGHRFELAFQQHKGATFFNVIRRKGMTQAEYEKACEMD